MIDAAEDRLHVACFHGKRARAELDAAGGLVNLVGLAKHWGCAKSTAFWWAARPGFPDPVRYEGQNGSVKLWLVAEADAFREAWRGERVG